MAEAEMMTNPILTDSQQMLAHALAAKDAEIERLQRDLKQMTLHAGIAELRESELQGEVERLEKRAILLEQTLDDLLNHPATGCDCIPCQVLHAEVW